jgi:aminocarboxymuconate-semialdehyde decarboxylase
MPIIDVHAHIIVPEITRAAAPAEAWRPNVTWENGRQVVEWAGRRLSSARREFVRPERVLAELEASGVDGALLCPWVSLTRYGAPTAEALAACQVQNDALAALARQHPGRLAALGITPLQDVPQAVAELERLMQCGLKGVEVGSQVSGTYLGDARFRPFWAACQALGAVVFIHPLEGGVRTELREYYMWNVVGNPMETTVTAAHLILSGVMDTYPDLKIVLAHGGGTAPWLRGRWDRGHAIRPEISQVIGQPPSDYLRRFYFDTITHDPAVLRWLVEFAGPGQVLLGSDYPFDMGNERPADFVRAAGLGAEAEALILGGNAARLLGWAG